MNSLISEMDQPKLLIVYPNQFGYLTDTYKYCEYLYYKYDITYICIDQGFEKMTLPGINIIYIPFHYGKMKRLIMFYLTVFSVSKKVKFNVIFTVQFKFCFLIGLFCKSKLKILDYRSGDLSFNLYKRSVKNFLMKFDSYFFNKISVISEGLLKILRLKKHETLVLPLGADVLSSRERSYDRMDLLYVGIIHIRNIHKTIEGLAIFLKSNKSARPQVSYTIIGFGTQQDIDLIQDTISNLGLNDKVKFLGRKKYSDLYQYFDKCNIGVSFIPITPYFEHQPATKTFEYALSGLFNIATNTYVNRQVINESNGILCNDTPEDFANALIEFYEKRHLISEKLIRDSLMDFHWQAIVKNKLEPFLETN